MRTPSLPMMGLSLLCAAGLGCNPTLPESREKTVEFVEEGRDTNGTPLEAFSKLNAALVDFRGTIRVSNRPSSGELHSSEIDMVTMTGAELSVVTPDADLSFLSRVTLEIEAPGKERTVLAYCEGFATGVRLVKCEVAKGEYRDYVVHPQQKVWARVEDSTRPERAVRLKLALSYTMQVYSSAYKRQSYSYTIRH